MSLASEVITRIGSQKLIELTNQSGAQTTINTDVLNAACADAAAVFSRVTGIAFDEANAMHIATLISGVIWKLEEYKSRDSGVVQSRAKSFFADCKGILDSRYWGPKTNSPLAPTKPKYGTRPDMDASKIAFRQRGRSTNISETFEDE